MWTNKEHAIFLKYCPNPRDRCYHAMTFDTSCRPSELLSRKISDIKFKTSSEGIQYAEITVNGKTGVRSLPLIESIPSVKEWIQSHPTETSLDSWLFVSMSNKNKSISPLTREGLLKHYKEQYRDRLFPKLLEDKNVPEVDKSFIRNMLTKPFSLYVFRHSALTEKSSYLKEHMLRRHAGWSMTRKMPQRYLPGPFETDNRDGYEVLEDNFLGDSDIFFRATQNLGTLNKEQELVLVHNNK